MHQYLLDLRNTLKASSEDDESYILHCVSSFIFGQYQKGGKNSNWGNAFKEYVKHNYVGPYLSEIFATVDINALTEVCNKSAFSLYDKSRWYREKIDY